MLRSFPLFSLPAGQSLTIGWPSHPANPFWLASFPWTICHRLRHHTQKEKETEVKNRTEKRIKIRKIVGKNISVLRKSMGAVCVCDDCDDLSTRMRCRKSHVTSHLFPSDRPACTIGRKSIRLQPITQIGCRRHHPYPKMGQAAQASHSAVLILFLLS